MGGELLRQTRAAHQRFGVSRYAKRPSPESIRAKAEAEIRSLDEWEARQERRVVLVCEKCQRYRWGRAWREGGMPVGYVEVRDYCPKCDGKGVGCGQAL